MGELPFPIESEKAAFDTVQNLSGTLTGSQRFVQPLAPGYIAHDRLNAQLAVELHLCSGHFNVDGGSVQAEDG